MSKNFISFSDVSSNSYESTSTSQTKPTSTCLSPVYQGVNETLSTVSKKLMKKDETTKLKALSDLIEFSNTVDESTVQDFLPNYFYLFIRLFYENNRQIRSKMLTVLQIFAKVNNRAFGPYMKSVIGYWWVLSSDTCQEVAEVSSSAFEAAIPPKKRASVLEYLLPDIMTIIVTNLKHTVNSMSADAVTTEEATERYERINCSCLLALTCLTKRVPESHLMKVMDSNDNLNTLQSADGNSVLDLVLRKLKDSNPSIRRQSYTTLTSLIISCPLLFTSLNSKQLSKLVNKILNNMLEERTAVNMSVMFESFVTIFKAKSDWFYCVDIPSQVIAKLQSLLTCLCSSTGNTTGGALTIEVVERSAEYVVPIVGSIPPDLLSLSTPVTSSSLSPCELNVSLFINNIFPALKSNYLVIPKTDETRLSLTAHMCVMESSLVMLLRRKKPTDVAPQSDDSAEVVKSDPAAHGAVNTKSKRKQKNADKDAVVLESSGEDESLETLYNKLISNILSELIFFFNYLTQRLASHLRQGWCAFAISSDIQKDFEKWIITDKTEDMKLTSHCYKSLKATVVQLHRATMQEIKFTKVQWTNQLWEPLTEFCLQTLRDALSKQSADYSVAAEDPATVTMSEVDKIVHVFESFDARTAHAKILLLSSIFKSSLESDLSPLVEEGINYLNTKVHSAAVQSLIVTQDVRVDATTTFTIVANLAWKQLLILNRPQTFKASTTVAAATDALLSPWLLKVLTLCDSIATTQPSNSPKHHSNVLAVLRHELLSCFRFVVHSVPKPAPVEQQNTVQLLQNISIVTKWMAEHSSLFAVSVLRDSGLLKIYAQLRSAPSSYSDELAWVPQAVDWLIDDLLTNHNNITTGTAVSHINSMQIKLAKVDNFIRLWFILDYMLENWLDVSTRVVSKQVVSKIVTQWQTNNAVSDSSHRIMCACLLTSFIASLQKMDRNVHPSECESLFDEIHGGELLSYMCTVDSSEFAATLGDQTHATLGDVRRIGSVDGVVLVTSWADIRHHVVPHLSTQQVSKLIERLKGSVRPVDIKEADHSFDYSKWASRVAEVQELCIRDANSETKDDLLASLDLTQITRWQQWHQCVITVFASLATSASSPVLTESTLDLLSDMKHPVFCLLALTRISTNHSLFIHLPRPALFAVIRTLYTFIWLHKTYSSTISSSHEYKVCSTDLSSFCTELYTSCVPLLLSLLRYASHSEESLQEISLFHLQHMLHESNTHSRNFTTELELNLDLMLLQSFCRLCLEKEGADLEFIVTTDSASLNPFSLLQSSTRIQETINQLKVPRSYVATLNTPLSSAQALEPGTSCWYVKHEKGKMRAVKVIVRGVHKEGVVEPFYTVETIPDASVTASSSLAAGDAQPKEIQTTRQRLLHAFPQSDSSDGVMEDIVYDRLRWDGADDYTDVLTDDLIEVRYPDCYKTVLHHVTQWISSELKKILKDPDNWSMDSATNATIGSNMLYRLITLLSSSLPHAKLPNQLLYRLRGFLYYQLSLCLERQGCQLRLESCFYLASTLTQSSNTIGCGLWIVSVTQLLQSIFEKWKNTDIFTNMSDDAVYAFSVLLSTVNSPLLREVASDMFLPTIFTCQKPSQLKQLDFSLSVFSLVYELLSSSLIDKRSGQLKGSEAAAMSGKKSIDTVNGTAAPPTWTSDMILFCLLHFTLSSRNELECIKTRIENTQILASCCIHFCFLDRSRTEISSIITDLERTITQSASDDQNVVSLSQFESELRRVIITSDDLNEWVRIGIAKFLDCYFCNQKDSSEAGSSSMTSPASSVELSTVEAVDEIDDSEQKEYNHDKQTFEQFYGAETCSFLLAQIDCFHQKFAPLNGSNNVNEATTKLSLSESQEKIDVTENVISFLLTWLLCLQMVENSPQSKMGYHGHESVKVRCGRYLRRSGVFNKLMFIFLKLAPDLLINKTVDLSNAFQRFVFVPNSSQSQDCGSIEWLTIYTLFRTCCYYPAMVRGWWSDDACSRVQKARLSKFIEDRVRKALVGKEIALINIAAKTQWDAKELTVQGSVASGEVSAIYVREDAKVEMKIKMPSEYPLKNVEVECTTRLGVADSKWRRWVLQMVQLLSTQDGSIVDAIVLWKNNVQNEFEGVEPCPICYSVLDVKTLKLPSLKCPTCANTFHSQCLYTWFKSSGKSKCVLCQQPFFQ